MTSGRNLAGAAALTCLLLALAACTPPPRPGTPLETLASRYAAHRARRAALLGGLTADLVVRLDGRATGRLPALSATLALGGPDRLRLRAAGLLGVAIDVLCARDSLFAWVPSQSLALAAPAESLGVHAPAALAGRVLAATWEPPASAWRDATSDSDATRLAWRDGEDSLALAVGADALPREAWVGRGATGVRVRYEAWTSVRGEPLPSRWRLADDSGWARARVECSGAAAGRARDAWFTPRRMAGARTLGWDDLRAWLAGREVR